MDLDKKINKSIKFLQKYTKKNKKSDNDNNFVYVFLLYCQIKYKIKFDIVKNVNIEPKLFDCCRYLYSDMKKDELKNNLFEENKETNLQSIFISVEGYWEKNGIVESNYFYNCYGNFIVSSMQNQTGLLTEFFKTSSWKTRDFH